MTQQPVDPRNQAEATAWNGPSGRAWVELQELLDTMYRPIEALLVEAVAARGGRRVLDVGCGTGGTTVAVARRLGASGRSIGIDISEPMTTAARTRAERANSGATFICADAQAYPFEPGYFDLIMSRFGVMFFDDPVRAFANLRRAARDHGSLRFAAWRSAAENPFMTTAERAAAPLLPDLPPREPDAPGQFALENAERVRGILEQSGWSGIEVRPLELECTMPESALQGYVTRLGPVGMALQEADDRTRARVVEIILPAFAPYVHGPDVRFTAACWLVGARAGARE